MIADGPRGRRHTSPDCHCSACWDFDFLAEHPQLRSPSKPSPSHAPGLTMPSHPVGRGR